MKLKSTNSAVIRLQELSELLSMYSHVRGDRVRSQMNSLLDEYDQIKNSNKEEWNEFCKIRYSNYEENDRV
jgi:16S rRNA G527 N7-methylase RsmG